MTKTIRRHFLPLAVMADERLSASIAASNDPLTTPSSRAIDIFSTDGVQQDDGSEVWYNSVEDQDNSHEDQGTMTEQAAGPSVEVPSPLAPAEDNGVSAQPVSTATAQTGSTATRGQAGQDSDPLVSPPQSPNSLTGTQCLLISIQSILMRYRIHQIPSSIYGY